MITTYRTIQSPSSGEYKDKGSKFIAVAAAAYTEEEVKELIAKLRKEHPKNRHVCYAFSIGTDNVIERSNDDGEPSGTAGKPILGQIHSFKLNNIAIAVVRYFGGTLLGVPGLIQAYKTASSEALNGATIIEKHIHAVYEINTGYAQFHEIMNYLKRETVTVLGQEMNDDCVIKLSVHPGAQQKLQSEIEDKFGIIANFKYYA